MIDGWWFFGVLAVAGILTLSLGLLELLRRVAINEQGMSKTCWEAEGEPDVQWQTVKSWCVYPVTATTKQEQEAQTKLRQVLNLPVLFNFPDDSFTFQAIVFKLNGQSWPFVVYDTEAWRPSFDLLVEDVRRLVGEKEINAPPAS